MLDFFKRAKKSENPQKSSEKLSKSEESQKSVNSENPPIPDKPENTSSLFSRLKQSLSRTRDTFTSNLAQIFNRSELNDDLLEELENILLSADVGIAATEEILKDLQKRIKLEKIKTPNELVTALQEDLTNILLPFEVPLSTSAHNPFVILVVGINGAGKTTTIGKLAKQFQSAGKSVMLAAGDTFRAAAIEQIQVWGQRNQIPVIAQQPGSDSASVIFDAYQAAKAKKVDILIADTAGRLHTQTHLMEELKKSVRVLKKIDESAPHEVLLVLDASIGQNALNQAEQFHQSVALTGLTITKLDGTARGGIIFNIAKTLKCPIRYIGIGEGIEDLKIFAARPFVEALFSDFNKKSEGQNSNEK